MTAVAPVLLKSMEEICKAFGKGRRSIKEWQKKGAPIFVDNGVYGAELNALSNWLVQQTTEKIDQKIQ